MHMSQQEIIANYLNTHYAFFERGLKEEIASSCTIKTFKAGDVLMQSGQYFRSTMLMVSGRVKLYRENEEGGEFFMYYIESGQACALSLICAARQEASQITARAVEDTKLLLLPISMMDTLMTTYKSWYYFVLETYRQRYEELLVTIDHIAFKSMDERLERYLQTQFEKLGTSHLTMTHQEIANDLHTSREVISRLLKKMEQANKLRLNRSFIEWLG